MKPIEYHLTRSSGLSILFSIPIWGKVSRFVRDVRKELNSRDIEMVQKAWADTGIDWKEIHLFLNIITKQLRGNVWRCEKFIPEDCASVALGYYDGSLDSADSLYPLMELYGISNNSDEAYQIEMRVFGNPGCTIGDLWGMIYAGRN